MNSSNVESFLSMDNTDITNDSGQDNHDPGIGDATNQLEITIRDLPHDLQVATQALTETLRRRDDTGRLLPRDNEQSQNARREVEAIRDSSEALQASLDLLRLPITVNRAPSQPATQGHRGTCRLPHGMPTFRRPGANRQVTVLQFLSTFERLLKANEYPMHQYVDALAASCGNDEAEWVSARLQSANMSGPDAKALFVEHFVDKNSTDLFRNQLETMSMRKGESVTFFADHYQSQMRLASLSVDSPDQIFNFTTKLPINVRWELNKAKLHQLATQVSVNTVIDAASPRPPQ